MSTQFIDLIRHGEPQGGSRYRGHGIDDPLSEKGWQQMREAVSGRSDWQHIITSPMRRCSEFAHELADQLQVNVSIENNLKEIGFGEWEGRTAQEIKQENFAQWQAFYRDPAGQRPPGAEGLEAFYQRVSDAFFAACAQHPEQHLLVVAHAGVIRALTCAVLQAPASSMYRINIPNAGMTRFSRDEFGFKLETVNA